MTNKMTFIQKLKDGIVVNQIELVINHTIEQEFVNSVFGEELDDATIISLPNEQTFYRFKVSKEKVELVRTIWNRIFFNESINFN